MIYQSNRQAGGTILGLIIGLIIGLAIAVGVAVTIKNTPLPFVNKLGKQDKTPDKSPDRVVAPNTSNTPPPVAPTGPVDPNKPLYGNREAARQAAKDVPRKSDQEQAVDAEVEAKKAEAQREETRRAETRAKAAAAREAAKPPVVERSTVDGAVDDKFTYYLQAGAFLERADAENAKAKLALMGLSAGIAERKTDNGTLYRVRLGPFGNLETMNRVRSRLSDNGVDVAVVRVPK
jgi:cell division protein FtsN